MTTKQRVRRVRLLWEQISGLSVGLIIHQNMVWDIYYPTGTQVYSSMTQLKYYWSLQQGISLVSPYSTYRHFIYVERTGPERQDVITDYNLQDYPKELQKKVTLLQHFKNYLEGEELKDKRPNTTDIVTPSKHGFTSCYVKKWMRTKHAIMFRMNNKVVQVIFQDQTEIILSSELKVVTYVNKKQERLHYPLSIAVQSTNQEMSKRLKYTKDILTQMLGGNAKPTQSKLLNKIIIMS